MSTNNQEIFAYIIVGILTTVIGLVVYYFLTCFIFDPSNKLEIQYANIITWIISIVFAYFANRKFVFQSKQPNIALEALKFAFARIGTLFLDMVLMFILVSMMNLNHRFVKLGIQFVIIIANYLLSKFLIFARKEEVYE